MAFSCDVRYIWHFLLFKKIGYRTGKYILEKKFAFTILLSKNIITFASETLAESPKWAKVGATYTYKGVTVRFGFDELESRKFKCLSRTKQRGRPMEVYHI